MASRTLELYSPHEAQLKFHASASRYRVAAWGRQSGKSTGALNDDLKFAWENPSTTTWYVSPTYEQAKVQYRRLVGMLWECPEVMVKKNQTELRVKLINQSQIRFVSGDSYQNLRGETLHKATIDEVRDQHPDLWPMVIRPMLSTTGGRCSFISTPSGFDYFYDLAQMAQSDTTGTWSFMHAPSTANPLFTQAELDAARAQMPEAIFAQEILAEFRDLTSGKAYLNFTPENLTSKNPFVFDDQPLSPWLPIVIGCDFNISPMAWSLGQHRLDEWYWFDEIWLKDSNTQEATRELIHRLLAIKSQGLLRANPQVIVCGDASSKARQRAAASSSDYDIMMAMLRDAGLIAHNETPDSNPTVKDRVNTVNARARSADGKIKLWVNPACKMLKRDLERVVWKPGAQATLDQTSNPELTHASDGIGYAMCQLTPIQGVHDVGTLRVITR